MQAYTHDDSSALIEQPVVIQAKTLSLLAAVEIIRQKCNAVIGALRERERC
jgi:hypothetical protein